MAVEPRAAAVALWLAAAGALAQPADPAACTQCHGPGGNSTTPTVPSIAGQPRIFLENQLVLIREGLRDVPLMAPVVKGLSDEQIIELSKHFASAPVTAAAAPADEARRRRGAEVSKRGLCGTCHLSDYRGQNQVPRLAGQQETYLLATLKMYRDKPAPGRDTAMSAVLYGLKDEDLDGLAHYLARAAN
jgi:cytochrome c553